MKSSAASTKSFKQPTTHGDTFDVLLSLYGLQRLGDKNMECGVICDRNNKLTFISQIDNRLALYYTTYTDRVSSVSKLYFYVNIHAKYNEDQRKKQQFFDTLINKTITDIFTQYAQGKHIGAIYFVGDFNHNYTEIMFNPNINGSTSVTIFTTPAISISSSLADNKGTLNPHNIDYIVRYNF